MEFTCETFRILQDRVNRKKDCVFTRERILKFTLFLVQEMTMRACENPFSPRTIYKQMTLPPSNETNLSLEIYAFQILFACAILELKMEDLGVTEEELSCALIMLRDIQERYNIANPSLDSTRDQYALGEDLERIRNFYKRDILPVFTPYARTMYSNYKMSTRKNIEREINANSGAGAGDNESLTDFGSW